MLLCPRYHSYNIWSFSTSSEDENAEGSDESEWENNEGLSGWGGRWGRWVLWALEESEIYLDILNELKLSWHECAILSKLGSRFVCAGDSDPEVSVWAVAGLEVSIRDSSVGEKTLWHELACTVVSRWIEWSSPESGIHGVPVISEVLIDETSFGGIGNIELTLIV